MILRRSGPRPVEGLPGYEVEERFPTEARALLGGQGRSPDQGTARPVALSGEIERRTLVRG
jgi:hypothetical protein